MSLPTVASSSNLSMTSTLRGEGEGSSSRKATPAPSPPDSRRSSLGPLPQAHTQVGLEAADTAASCPPSRARALSRTQPELRGGIPITRRTTLDNGLAGPLSRVLSSFTQGQGPTSTSASPSAQEAAAAGADAEAIPNPYPGRGTPDEPYLVDWLPGEAANPYEWSSAYRWLVTAVVALATLCIAFVSSSYSAAVQDVMRAFPDASTEEGIAGLSLYVLGFGVGPLIWAPVSEIWGRNVSFFASYPLFVLWNMAGALAPNIPSILVFRFLAGTFGSAPLVTAGAQIGDLWAPHERALATSLYALAPFLGPVLGPIVGGFVVESAGWRWVFWVQCIFAGVMLVISALLVPETYAPTLLRRKAKMLQKEANASGTGEHFISKYDVLRKDKLEIVKLGMTRPFAMLAQEVIVLALGVYAALIYGILYLFFTAFPIIFQQSRGWSLSHSGLAFLGIGVGLVIGNALTPIGQRLYLRAVARAGPGGTAPPEARLPMMCVGAIMLPIGLFWFAWTSQPTVHWIVPILASVPFGAGFLLIFVCINLYLIDSYTVFAASALASNAVCRSVFGTIFPLFSTYLYRNLGLNWAGTLLAFLSLLCAPLPFLFMRYGPYLRRNSRYAPSGVKGEEREVAQELEPGLQGEGVKTSEKRGAEAV